jgi:hypothetical protein
MPITFLLSGPCKWFRWKILSTKGYILPAICHVRRDAPFVPSLNIQNERAAVN